MKGNSNVSLTSALDALSTVLRYPARVVALSVAPQKAPVPDGNAPVLENGIEGAPHDKSYLPQALSKIMGKCIRRIIWALLLSCSWGAAYKRVPRYSKIRCFQSSLEGLLTKFFKNLQKDSLGM